MTSKASCNVSKLNLLHGKSPETCIPLYKGSDFTYVKDDLGMPTNAGFSALTSILRSCDSIITEFKFLPGSLQFLVNYDK